jgi:hypothetical protein
MITVGLDKKTFLGYHFFLNNWAKSISSKYKILLISM